MDLTVSAISSVVCKRWARRGRMQAARPVRRLLQLPGRGDSGADGSGSGGNGEADRVGIYFKRRYGSDLALSLPFSYNQATYHSTGWHSQPRTVIISL